MQFHLSLGGISLILGLHVQHSSLKTFWIGRGDILFGLMGLLKTGGDVDKLWVESWSMTAGHRRWMANEEHFSRVCHLYNDCDCQVDPRSHTRKPLS